MKLRNLNGLIRKTKHVKLAFDTPVGQMLVILVKQDLLETLETLYRKDGSAETGLMITPSGLLALEGAAKPSVDGATDLDWMPAVAAAAEKLRQFASKPVLTNDGQVVLAGELKDLAADLTKLVGAAPEEAPSVDLDDMLADEVDSDLEGLLS